MDSPKLLGPLVLAYQGDVVYELMVRRRLIETTRLGVSALHRETVKRVCAHYQSLAMEILEPMLTQEEQGRRFSEMSRIYGQDFKLPETHTLVLNAANPVVKGLLNAEGNEETRSLIAAQLYDLARMSTRPLEKEEVTAFLARSNKLLELLSER